MNLLDLIAPAKAAGRRALKEADAFAATVTPGRTYYSIVDCHWAWGRGRLLMEWTFTKPTFWSGGKPMCDHMTAAGVWLSYGPIFERRPGGLETLDEYRRREFPIGFEKAVRTAKLTAAGR